MMPRASSTRWFAVLTAEARRVARERGVAYPADTREGTAAINAEAERRLGARLVEMVEAGR